MASSSSSTSAIDKHVASEPPSGEPPSKRQKYDGPGDAKLLNEPVFKIYKDYLAGTVHADMEHMAEQCYQHGIPTIEDVNWLMDEAQIVDDKHRLNYLGFYFMQDCSWYVHSTPGQNLEHRLFVGRMNFLGEDYDVWAGWPGGTQRLRLYECPGPVPGQPRGELGISEEQRKYITWAEPFNYLFKFGDMLNGQESNTHAAALLQNRYLLAVIKVLVRFPGLVMVPDKEEPGLQNQIHGEFSLTPFTIREERSTENPYQQFADKINTGYPPRSLNPAIPEPEISTSTSTPSRSAKKGAKSKKTKKQSASEFLAPYGFDSDSDSDLDIDPSKTIGTQKAGAPQMPKPLPLESEDE